MDYSNYLNRDYKSVGESASSERPRIRRKHLHLLAISSVAIGLVALFSPSHDAEATRQITQSTSASGAEQTREQLLQMPLTLPNHSAESDTKNTVADTPDLQTIPWQNVSVNAGDSLSLIFDRLHISPQQLHAIVADKQAKSILTSLRPKQELEFQIDDNNDLQAIRYTLSPEKTLLVTRDGDGFTSQLIEQPIEIRLTHASGTIGVSLFQAGQAAGMSDNLIMELANIFAWDVDFALDIRKGDSFNLMYEEDYLDGEKLRDGRILAAEFVNQGHTYRAVLFTDPEGNSQYFSEDGRSMKKAFLRSPVDFRRISSTFQRERYHPILGRKRPHQGVDYAAATGTPIKAAGDGKVIFRGRKGGYGNTIVLQHGGSISTLYGHMSKFRKGVSTGRRVKQGQIIGYVGMTGLATGPHLHYEFRINGVHRNPLTVKLPDAAPVPAKYKAEFEKQSKQFLAQLDLFKRVQVAANNP